MPALLLYVNSACASGVGDCATSRTTGPGTFTPFKATDFLHEFEAALATQCIKEEEEDIIVGSA